MKRCITCLLIAALCLQGQETPVFRASSNLVVVTVFVQDRQGQPLRELSRSDFTVLENGKPQAISVFEYQNIEGAAGASPASVVGAAAPSPSRLPPPLRLPPLAASASATGGC